MKKNKYNAKLKRSNILPFALGTFYFLFDYIKFVGAGPIVETSFIKQF